MASRQYGATISAREAFNRCGTELLAERLHVDYINAVDEETQREDSAPPPHQNLIAGHPDLWVDQPRTGSVMAGFASPWSSRAPRALSRPLEQTPFRWSPSPPSGLIPLIHLPQITVQWRSRYGPRRYWNQAHSN